MDRMDECICCQEVAATRVMCASIKNEGAMYADQPTPNCITQHPGFAAICLNRFLLRPAWHQYKQQYQDSYEGPEHKKFRHIAYRQLARWCWGYLGKEVCVVLPACAVMCIRAHFPPPGLDDNFITWASCVAGRPCRKLPLDLRVLRGDSYASKRSPVPGGLGRNL